MKRTICPICNHYIEPDETIVKIRIGRTFTKWYHESCCDKVRAENGFRNFNVQHNGGKHNEKSHN